GEGAGIQQVDLAAAGLFGGCADELDGDVRGAGGRRMQEGADVRHGDEVVTAAVTNAGERVVLGDERERRSGRTDACAKGRLKSADTHLNLVAVALKKHRDPCCGTTFLVCELRIGMDLAGELDQLVDERRGERLHYAVYCPIATIPR